MASKAATETGWLEDTILHLANEIRTTDGSTRVMVTTDDDYTEIQARIGEALDGAPDDKVDYSTAIEDS